MPDEPPPNDPQAEAPPVENKPDQPNPVTTAVAERPHDKCGAKTRTPPFGPCQLIQGFGTDHPGTGLCKFHGGASPGGRQQGFVQRVEAQARVLLGREDLRPIENPLLELQKLAAEVIAFKTILADRVEELQGWTYTDLTETEQVRAVVLAYERALDRCNTVLAGIVRLNIDERFARVSEIQAALLVGIFDTIFTSREVALSRDQVLTMKAIVAREIPKVTGRAA